jgi:hypothetical protein
MSPKTAFVVLSIFGSVACGGSVPPPNDQWAAAQADVGRAQSGGAPGRAGVANETSLTCPTTSSPCRTCPDASMRRFAVSPVTLMGLPSSPETLVPPALISVPSRPTDRDAARV